MTDMHDSTDGMYKYRLEHARVDEIRSSYEVVRIIEVRIIESLLYFCITGTIL